MYSYENKKIIFRFDNYINEFNKNYKNSEYSNTYLEVNNIFSKSILEGHLLSSYDINVIVGFLKINRNNVMKKIDSKYLSNRAYQASKLKFNFIVNKDKKIYDKLIIRYGLNKIILDKSDMDKLLDYLIDITKLDVDSLDTYMCRDCSHINYSFVNTKCRYCTHEYDSMRDHDIHSFYNICRYDDKKDISLYGINKVEKKDKKEIAGCYHCRSVVSIKKLIKEDNIDICPNCNVDSIIKGPKNKINNEYLDYLYYMNFHR